MTTVSNTNVWTDVTICIPDLGYKSMDTLVFPRYIELWKDYCVCGMLSINNKSTISVYRQHRRRNFIRNSAVMWSINKGKKLKKIHFFLMWSLHYRKDRKKKGVILTLAAPPIQYFWADSQGVLMTNSPVFESYVVTVSIPRTWKHQWKLSKRVCKHPSTGLRMQTKWLNNLNIHYSHAPTLTLQSNPWLYNSQCPSATCRDGALCRKTEWHHPWNSSMNIKPNNKWTPSLTFQPNQQISHFCRGQRLVPIIPNKK